MWRCTSYVALHPFRTGALPTDRVHRPHSQAQPRIRPPPHAQALHHPLLRRTTWTDIALLTRQRNAPPSSATLPLTNPTAARVATTQGTTSTTGHCTRYVALHLLRGAAPVQNGCIAYGSGAAPTLTSTTVDHSTTRANFNTTTAGPTQRNDRSTSTHGRQYPKPHHVSDLPDRGLNSFRI